MTAWTPPADPDPSAILNDAEKDVRNGHHARALAQFLWFHHNALRYHESLAGVRLSFALSSWRELAKVYPPAHEAFARTRDETEAALAAEPTSYELFSDLASLNQYLGDGVRTADAFERAVRESREDAAWLYRTAEPYLIGDGRYEACGPFLDPAWRLPMAADSYRIQNAWEASGQKCKDGSAVPKLARRFYIDNVATLVALLVLNRRPEEAARARDEALKVIDDGDFRITLAAALGGHLPLPLHGDAS